MPRNDAACLDFPPSVQGTDFFEQFDTDGDGYICFGEYLLIVTFLSIPLEVESLGSPSHIKRLRSSWAVCQELSGLLEICDEVCILTAGCGDHILDV